MATSGVTAGGGRLQARFQVTFEAFSLDVELDLPAQGITALFGPSGSGKSTVLRCLAGLERSGSGVMQLGDRVWQDELRGLFVPPHRRSLGYVFQEPRLFPHLTVAGNLDFGHRRTPLAERRLGWDQVIELLDLHHLLARRPARLSLGEQQRVAIGRALLASPDVLLMDEPLASLDLQRKREVLPFIRKLHDELDIPVIYVSHSLTEILQITDTLVLMRDGRSVATGSLHTLCGELGLSDYLGEMAGAVIETRIVGHDEAFGLSTLRFDGGELLVPQQTAAVGEALRVHVLAKNVGIALARPDVATSFLNVLPATVAAIETPQPGRHTVQIKLDIGVPLLASISRKSLHTLQLRPGQSLYALIKAVSLAQEVGYEQTH